MVNLTDPNSYAPGGRTWVVAFVGTAGDLALLEANGKGLLPDPSSVSHTDEDAIAYWPTDSAAITVWEVHRCVCVCVCVLLISKDEESNL